MYGEVVALVLYVFGIGITLIIFYAIIKNAVKNGINESELSKYFIEKVKENEPTNTPTDDIPPTPPISPK